MNLKIDKTWNAMSINQSCENYHDRLNFLLKITNFFSLPPWINYNTQLRTWIYIWKIGAPYFSELNTLIHELICVKIFFFQHPSKMTMEPSQWADYFSTQTESITASTEKGRLKGIEDLMNCAVTLLFYLFQWNWGSFALHKMIPLK